MEGKKSAIETGRNLGKEEKMKREIDLKEISDGKLYGANDMVKADCHDCIGCSDCCKGMGNSIILDPMDIWRITYYKNITFEQLLEKYIELNVVDGMVLPNLKLAGEEEACAFLNQEGRCSIHRYRPGICRLFPLGRVYEEEGFHYFLQIKECSKKEKSKIKVKKWLQIENISAYEKYILSWHNFLKECEAALPQLPEEQRKVLVLFVLKTFYRTPFVNENFYEEYYRRLKDIKQTLGME